MYAIRSYYDLYTERQVEPLNVFLARAEPAAAAEAIRGYGHAIRDLAAANIFTGDMLLKNFGVTRHGRVIFYDYDESKQFANPLLFGGSWYDPETGMRGATSYNFV